MKTLHSLALLGVSLGTLAACSQSPATMEVATQEHRRIEAQEITRYLEIAGVATGYLTPDDRRKVEQFAGAFKDEGYGAIVVTAPEGLPRGRLAVVEVAALLEGVGVRSDKVVQSGYDAAGDVSAPLVLAYKSYEAHVPGCSKVNEHDWANMKTNTTVPSFGCAVNENIAMMLANPGDVLGQRELDAPDPNRQLMVYEKYRTGNSTTSGQTADGSVTQ